ncbi:MAG: aminotransferase class I/II-fold pyridoxal phosphate-dependent enzyme [Proteobacteria bacterium]|jgi:dTDP-4-amino-4,6-dideoxygalactose transaminase|nr:aminotransferase class I/II-fold pyridoxal phosphate-dependent enzyme [Pseudomonadota bacterium]
MTRIYLSPPHVFGNERALVTDAFDSNWIAPLGPHVTAFEKEMCEKLGAGHACALSSGTAGLHLALLMLGVGRDDEVFCSTLTFSASANAIAYVGARPVFVDCDAASWNMDPALLAQGLEDAAKRGKLPKAVIVVDLYGQCADYDPILEACARYGIPVVEDAAEALGATYKGKHAGTFGEMAILSFNGNKIITTAGGGMLLSPHEEHVRRALFLATQAREPAPHYEHEEIGYNYRLSNVLAAIGRGQLATLDARVEARRKIFDKYVAALGALPGVSFMPEAPYGRCNRWLTCLTIDAEALGATPEQIRLHLESRDIEARPVWKPMHLQPVFKDCRSLGGAVSAELFSRGLCLPSGSSLSDADQDRVVEAVNDAIDSNR